VSLDNAVLMASIIGETAVCTFLWKKRVGRTMPFFCLYLVWSLISDLTFAFIIWRWTSASVIYGRFYLLTTAVDSILQFTILVELAWSVLRPVRASLPRKSLPILIILVALAGLAIWPLAAMTVPPSLTSLNALLFHFEETFAILRVALFLIMASFSQLLSIGWRDRELQVATGLGFYSIASLIVTTIHSHQSIAQTLPYHWLDNTLSICYLGSLTYWVYCFATKEQERKEFSPQMQNFLLLMSGGARSGRVALSDLPSKPPRKGIK
jgi:hypothetical protein